MKPIYYLLIILLDSMIGACTNDTTVPIAPTNADELTVSFNVFAPVDNLPVIRQATAGLSGNAQENMIQKIDILAFKVNPDNTEYFDYYAEGKLVSGAGTPKQTFRATMRMKDYNQRFVVIANAHDQVMELIGSVEWRQAPKDEMLKMLEFANKASDHKWHASNTAGFTPFPMWGEMPESQLITPSTTSIVGIPMLRMVAKIDVQVAEDDAVAGKKPKENFRLTEVYLYNVKDNGHVVPDRGALVFNAPNDLTVNKPTIPSAPANWTGPLKYITTDDVSLTGEIYTLEAKATDLSSNRLDATGLVIGGYYSKDGANWDTEPSYYRLDLMTSDKKATRDILRNYNYLVRITEVKGAGSPTPKDAWDSSTPMDLMAADWIVQAVPGDMGQRRLNTSAAKVSITGVTSSRIYFWTDQKSVKIEEKGFIGATGNTSFNVNDSFDDLAGSVNTSMFHFTSQTGEGYMDIATLMVNKISNDVRRIYLNAGGLRREIIVNTQIKYKPQPFNIFPWVGTFHRSNEVGERIIYSDHIGEWSAEVDDPQKNGSFVILSKVPSNNKNIGTDSPGNAEDYPVLDGVKSVEGKGRIYFRVGMASKYTPTPAKPARYASITLKYTGGTAKIYVRQGEEADFVMRNGDAPKGTSDISAIQRNFARKFSPYNLTDAQGRPGRVGDLQGTKYTFTEYPTQAGYYFQWDKTYAWYPDGLSPVNWNRGNNSGLWESEKAKCETCPPGYHRPDDGSTSTYVTLPKARDSEIRQSLYLNPRNATPGSGEFRVWGYEDSDNSLWGYYADGFFDRRAPRESRNAEKATVVGNGAQLAYAGRLFYNPYTNASVFFPASGTRYDGISNIPKGNIHLSGSRAYFWTATKYSSSYPIYQSASPERSILVETGNLMGMPVRCMKDQ